MVKFIMKKRVLSGIQPTGNIHIGNYIGAIRQWVDSQDKYDNIFCIVDLHAITVPIEPKQLKHTIRQLATLLFAAGITPEKSALFVQSHVSEHAEMAWIITCMTPWGWLHRMTQFKEKSSNAENFSVGLFAYPALMAADILLYDSDLVPVGEDQKQHLELTRDIAQRINALYGKDILKIPQAVIPEVGSRIMGLDDPTKKMSKSEDTANHAIHLLDTPDVIRRKIKRATTDSFREIRFNEERHGVNNLLTIYEAFTKMSRPDIESHFAGKGYGDLKKELTEVVIEGLRPLQTRYHELASDKKHVDLLLAEGADKVRATANRTLRRVHKTIGLG
ncbi:MAG: tryptophan--tRNA ligase [Anaerolineaceae bacterium 4572_78]|nr:MAG: tryptophan--tRNA ligase [Anaerolineaceae bacterium 4572_78]